jgi:hypothetical protein
MDIPMNQAFVWGGIEDFVTSFNDSGKPNGILEHKNFKINPEIMKHRVEGLFTAMDAEGVKKGSDLLLDFDDFTKKVVKIAKGEGASDEVAEDIVLHFLFAAANQDPVGPQSEKFHNSACKVLGCFLQDEKFVAGVSFPEINIRKRYPSVEPVKSSLFDWITDILAYQKKVDVKDKQRAQWFQSHLLEGPEVDKKEFLSGSYNVPNLMVAAMKTPQSSLQRAALYCALVYLVVTHKFEIMEDQLSGDLDLLSEVAKARGRVDELIKNSTGVPNLVQEGYLDLFEIGIETYGNSKETQEFLEFISLDHRLGRLIPVRAEQIFQRWKKEDDKSQNGRAFGGPTPGTHVVDGKDAGKGGI